MCEYWYGACVNATNQNLAQQFECEKAKNATCGTLTIDESGSVGTASSSAAGATGSASRTGGSQQSATGSASPAASSGAAALAQYGAPIVAGGLLAVFGLAL
jgi:hypothetical protein